MRLKPMLTSFLIGILFFTSCTNTEEHQNSTEKGIFCLDDNFKSKVELELPTKQVVTEGISLTGIVEANPDNVIHFVSLVGGIISNTNFSLGDKVFKGQVLAELRSTELSELQSQSKTIVSQIQVAENNLRSVQSMFDDGIASRKDLMEAERDLEVMKAERERIDANLSLFSASPEKGVFQIKSPTAGTVTAKSISSGSQISAEGEPLFTISDLSEVWVLVNVYATNVTNIDTGMDVSIKTLSYPDQIFEGKISTISQVLDADSKVLKARVVLANKNLKLKPGMIVDITALKELQTEALSIPTSALVFDNNQNYVVVHKEACEIEMRQVEILSKSNGVTFLLSGLKENEQIISKNQLLIYEQLKNFQN